MKRPIARPTPLTRSSIRSAAFTACERLEGRVLLSVAGDLDPSFGVNGETTVALDRGFVGWPKAVAVQPDGKTVVAGYYFNDASASPYGFALARYTLNGQPDTSFGDNHTGRVRTIFQDNDDPLTAAMAVAIQPDGKIVAAGRAHEHFAVARYNSDGSLDASFDGRGFKFFDYGVLDFTSEARAVLVQSDGKILIGGRSDYGLLDVNDDFALARLNPDGSFDTSFDDDGERLVGLGGQDGISDLAFDGGKITAVGTSIASGGAKLAVVRLNPGGGLDSSFDGDGVALLRAPGDVQTTGSSVVVQSGGRVVVGGGAGSQVGGVLTAARLLSNGALDPTFGPDGNGWAVTGFGSPVSPTELLAGADGSLIQVGTKSGIGHGVATKLSADGVTDTAFGTSGQHGYTFSIDAAAYGPGRRFVVAGGPGMHAARALDSGANLVSVATLNPLAAEAGPTPASFFVYRSERLPRPTRVYFTCSGTAVSPVSSAFPRLPADYTGVVAPPPSDVIYRDTGYVDIPANETFAAVTITPIDDTRVEGNETAVFTVRPDPAYDVGDPGAVTISIVDDDAPPPQVAAVFANGSTWAPSFRQFIQASGQGDADLGFSIAGGAGQLETLPWVNVDTVSVRFNEDVSVAAANLSLRGVNVPLYAFSAYQYDPATHTATWTLAQPLGKDKVLLDLDGDAGGVNALGARLDGNWTNGAGAFPSGDGAAGGDFKFRFNVLPGDTTRSGSVLADDYSSVKKKFFRNTASPITGTDEDYSLFHDVDGSGSVLANDYSAVKSRFFNTLPGAEPTALAATVVPAAAGGSPFGTRRIRPAEQVLA